MSATGRHSAGRRGFRGYRSQPRIDGVAYLERPPDRRNRFVRSAALGFLALLALGILTAARWGFATWSTATWDCPSWAPSVTPRCAPPPPRYAIEDYLTTTPGRAPDKYPEHADFLGLGDGTTPSEISRAFPPGTTHRVYPTHTGRHRETWTWKGVHYIATVVEASGRTTQTYVFRDDDSPYYVSAPNYLLLGATTVQEATYWSGAIIRIAPHADGSWYAEFSPTYSSVTSPMGYLAKAPAADPPAHHAGPPYPADTAPCLAVLYLETRASPGQVGLGAVPSTRQGESLSCR
jgi:hypothetical protein